jgi:ABC-2 type transport system permease protein
MRSRLISLIRKEFIQLWRDKRMLALIVVIPLVQIFLLGYAFNNDIRDMPLAVFDQSHSAESRALLEAYEASDFFELTYMVGSDAELKRLIDSNQVAAAMIIPPDYATQVQRGQGDVAFVLDGSDASRATTALSATQLITQDFANKLLIQKMALSGLNMNLQPPIEVHTNVWYNPDMISAYFMIPGVIGMILYTITAILTASSVVRERERGTIEQLIVTPIRSWELVIGKIVPYVIMSMFATFEVIAIGHWWFGVPIRSSLLMIALVSALFLLSGLGIGLLASTIAKTQQEATLTVFMTLLPGIFLSGFLFPLDNLPPFLKLLSYVIPLRYFLSIIRVLLLKGVGLESIRGDVIAMVLFGVAIMGAAASRFRKSLD